MRGSVPNLLNMARHGRENRHVRGLTAAEPDMGHGTYTVLSHLAEALISNLKEKEVQAWQILD